MDVLLPALVAFLVVTLAGHLLWLGVRAVFRRLFFGQDYRPPPAEECPRCGEHFLREQTVCPSCGLDPAGKVAGELADLPATARQLRRFLDAGTIEPDVFAQLRECVAERRRLLGVQPRPAPPPTPVPASVAPPPAAVAPIAPPPVAPEPPPAVAVAVPVLEFVEAPAAPAPPAAAVAPAPAPLEPPAPQRPPRRRLAELLTAFMEQRNILWGELLGGILIVGCSIMLVINFWKTLEQNPLYQFGIFVGLTAGLFGTGLYTLGHWKLETTSRGVLVIATLLVPLNFLALAAQPGDGAGWWEVTAEVASLAVFAALLFPVGHVLAPERRWAFGLAVLGPAAGQLLVPHVLGGGAGGVAFAVLAGLAVACYGLGTGVYVRAAARRPLEPRQAHSLFTVAGTATFALGAAFGLLAYAAVRQGTGLAAAFGQLAVFLAVAGVPVLAAGLTVHRGMADDPAAGGFRTAGTALTLAGVAVMLAATALAWPGPVGLLLVCALDFAVLTYVAFRYELPVVHGAALPCLAVGYLTAVYLARGTTAPDRSAMSLAEWFRSAGSGVALAGLLALGAGVSEVLVRLGRRAHAAWYAAGAGVGAAVSLALVTLPDRGAADPMPAAALNALYAVGGLACNARWRRPLVSAAALALVPAATLWVLWAAAREAVPAWGPVLAAEALVLGLAAASLREGEAGGLRAAYREPLARAAEGVGLLAVLAAVWAGWALRPWRLEYTVAGALLFLLYLLLAAVERRAWAARVAGLILAGTAAAVAGWAVGEAAPERTVAWVGLAVATAAALMAGVAVATAAPIPTRWPHVFSAAWRDTAAGAGLLALGLTAAALVTGVSAPPAYAGVLLTATALLLAWRCNWLPLTWVGVALALATLAVALAQPPADLAFPSPLLEVALLAHATLALAARLGVAAVSRPPADTGAVPWRPAVRRLYVEPLGEAALLTSALSLPLVLMNSPLRLQEASLCLAWLAGVWLLIAWDRLWPALWTAGQGVLALAACDLATVWLQRHVWAIDMPGPAEVLGDPRSLHVYGIALVGLSPAWVVARLALRGSPTARALLEPGWPAVDRIVLAVVVVGQLAVAVVGVLPAVMDELSAAPTGSADMLSRVHEPAAWALLGSVGATLVLALWNRAAPAAVAGLVIAALTVPFLAACTLQPEHAVEPGLRWGLAAAYGGLSVPVWLRGSLGRLGRRVGWQTAAAPDLGRVVRALLATGALAPVMVLTAADAAGRFGGVPAGPATEWPFGPGRWLASLGLPLAVLTLGLVGHALRERSPGYAFVGGLVANLAVTGAHALVLARPGAVGLAGGPLAVRLLQTATVTASAWAVAWLLVRAWYQARSPGPDVALARPLLQLQVGLGVAGNAAALGVALVLLAVLAPTAQAGWTTEAGSAWGWVALLAAALAAGARLACLQLPVRPLSAGWLGLAVLGLLACSVERLRPGAGYRTLMLGWALYPLVWAAAAWRTDAEAVRAAAAFWVRLAGGLAVLLSLKAAAVDDRLWAAAALAPVSLAAAAVALRERREGWAFAAGLGVNLAASLVVWDRYAGLPPESWFVPLAQANVSAGAVVALVWLTLRQRLYGPAAPSGRVAPLLTLQVVLLLAVNAAVLAGPVLRLLGRPGERLPVDLFVPIGSGAGLATLVLAHAAAAWYGRLLDPAAFVHALGGLGLSLGAWIACLVSRRAEVSLPAYALMATWLNVGFVIIGAWWRAPRPGPFEKPVRAWVLGVAGTVTVFAVRAAATWPGRAQLAAAVAAGASLLLGLLAVWSSWPAEVYGSGLLVNVAASLLWVARGPATAAGFLCTNALAFGLASAAWSLVERAGRRRPVDASLPFAHAAAGAAIGLTAAATALGVGGLFLDLPRMEVGGLAWGALAAAVTALVVLLWDRGAPYPAAGLYAAGPLAVALALLGAGLGPRLFGWAVPLALGPYALLAALVARFVPALWARMGAGAPPRRSDAWLVPAQVELAALVVALSVWVAIDFAEPGRRLAGPLAVAVLVPAGVLTVSRAGARADAVRLGTLTLGALAAVEAGSALVHPTGHTPGWLWLHRNVATMTALALFSVGYGVVLARRLRTPAWADASRRLGFVLGVVGTALLAVILVQEAALYDAGQAVRNLLAAMLRLGPPTAVTPAEAAMAPPAIGAVGLGLVGLILAFLAYAVVPGRDPLDLSERGRTAYVYAAEVLLVLFFVHFRITVPAVFRQGFFTRYWPFILMAIAFAGAGLSEFFHRRRVPVLAEPLERTGVFLPMLPVLAFWVLPAGNYAALWFTAGLLYALLSVARRSFAFALVAALSANMGLWVLLHAVRLSILEHPQAWLIPIALIVLASEHVNRDRLGPHQAAGLRYLGLVVIYVSSTADMFIGMGHSVVLPLVLALLSVLGVLAGMALRVRAFLFLGVTFLLVVVLSMIWHVGISRQQTWVLWACGIALGVALLVLFGIFEKRRNEVVRLLDDLRHWQ